MTEYTFINSTLMNVVDLGNIAAFIPFGFLLPWLYRISFARFITLFFLSMLVIETTQALTLLGSFDLNDAMIRMFA
ncbi:VanZ family protein [Paenibacillus taihuensis]|uniref:VanZ family protein n=1 Tax=Paenibacillus taihuensis TaxID=1156355 RepID=UPI000E25C2B1